MKKIKMALLAIATLTLLATIEGSEVFIEGRTVNIPSLWICDHEVTQEEYQAVMGSNPSYFSSSPARGEVQAKRPVECVSWYDALVYCNKRSIREGRTPCYKISGKSNPSEWGAVPTSSNSTWDAATCDFTADGYRLPTEAEWEYFARGGGWNYYGNYCTVSYRDCFYPHACYFYAFGFRVVSSKTE